MDVADDVRTAEHQQFIAAFIAPKIVGGGIAKLNVGAHGAVVNDDALVHRLQKVAHGRNHLASQMPRIYTISLLRNSPQMAGRTPGSVLIWIFLFSQCRVCPTSRPGRGPQRGSARWGDWG